MAASSSVPKADPGEPAPVRVWDPLVRALHWMLAGAVLVNYWLTESGSDLHTWVGYLAAAVVLVRIVWGFAGRGHARFDAFTPSMAGIREHIEAMASRRMPLDSGHNPLGALMIYLMFLLIAVLAVTGWLHEEVDALYGNDLLQEIHELAAHTLWICALLHVLAVFVVQHLGRIELVRPMITGWRRPQG